MKTLLSAVYVLVFLAAPAAAESLQMSFRDGRVSIDARDVTVRRILAEWARLGQTQIVNAERITGGPITLKLENLPEKQALEIILRAVPGYMALPRQTLSADASQYDRILVMPTTSPVATARPQGPPAFPGVQPGANVTQLRPMPPPLTPGTPPEPEPADQEDAAIAAAAAAGLVPVPAPTPAQSAIVAPLVLPGVAQPPAAQPPATAPSPANPFGAAATAAPTFSPQPAPPTTTTAPITRPRPPQPDR